MAKEGFRDMIHIPRDDYLLTRRDAEAESEPPSETIARLKEELRGYKADLTHVHSLNAKLRQENSDLIGYAKVVERTARAEENERCARMCTDYARQKEPCAQDQEGRQYGKLLGALYCASAIRSSLLTQTETEGKT